MRATPLQSLPAAALIAATLALTACGESTERRSTAQTPVRVIGEPVLFERERTRIEAVGTSRAMRSIELHPAAAGEVVAVNFEPGQLVNRGDVLVELDSRDEKLAVDLARVKVKDAERLLDRYQRTGASGAVLPTEIDAAATQVESARIELDRAIVAFDDRFIEAPFDGYVDYTEVDAGDRINPDTVITVLDDRTSLLISFDVPEIMVGQLEAGDEVGMTAWNMDSSQVTGEIVEIGSRIDPVTRTFTARATVNNTNDRLRPGMSFRVIVNIEGREFAVVAETAVKWGANGAYIWLIRDGKAVSTPVKIIQRRQGRALIDADLGAGDDVVVEGIQRLRNGVPVQYERTGISRRNWNASGIATAAG